MVLERNFELRGMACYSEPWAFCRINKRAENKCGQLFERSARRGAGGSLFGPWISQDSGPPTRREGRPGSHRAASCLPRPPACWPARRPTPLPDACRPSHLCSRVGKLRPSLPRADRQRGFRFIGAIDPPGDWPCLSTVFLRIYLSFLE